MFCTNCGFEFEGEFCPECGGKVDEREKQQICNPQASPLTVCGIYKVLGGTIDVRPDCVIIRRSYLLEKFETTISFSDIRAVQFADASFSENGFIHFETLDNSVSPVRTARQADGDEFSALFNAHNEELLQVAQNLAGYCDLQVEMKADEKAINAQIKKEQQDANKALRHAQAVEFAEQYRLDAKARIELRKEQQLEQKERIAENKLNKVPMCPKCKSASTQPNNGKFHLGRAIIGGTFLGDGGVVMGLTHGKRTPMVCLNCGHKWKL